MRGEGIRVKGGRDGKVVEEGGGWIVAETSVVGVWGLIASRIIICKRHMRAIG